MPDSDLYQSGVYWDNNPSFHEEDAEHKVTNAIRFLADHNIVPRDILDVGTGSGKHAFLMASHYDVATVGIDVSERAIQHALQHYSHPKLQYEQIEVGQYPSVSHLGIMFDVFEHVEDYIGFLKNAVSKSEYWLFNIPIDMNILSVLRGRYMVDRERVGHLHYFSKASAIATLEHSGYEVVDTRYINVVSHQLKAHFSFKGMVAALPRLTLFKLNQSIGVTLLGGASLMVLCKPRQG